MPTAENLIIRDYAEPDADDVNRIAVEAFSQFQHDYNDWPTTRANISKMSALSTEGQIFVAEHNSRISGAVAYFGPNAAKATFFDQAWPIFRLLVVDPKSQGLGIGRALTLACIARAKHDRAPLIALHTSPIMTVALPMYLRMGFIKAYDAQPISGVPYSVYTKAL